MKKTLLLFIGCLFLLQSFAQTKVFVVDETSDLYVVNPVTCNTRLIGNTDKTDVYGMLDIAMSPLTGVLYGVSSNGMLCTIDTTNANTTEIGLSGQFNALAFGDKNILYAAGPFGNQVYTIDLSSGTATYFAQFTSCTSSGGDLAFAHNKLYLATVNNTLEYIDLNKLSNSVVLDSLPGYSTYGLASTVDSCQSAFYSFSGNKMYNVKLDNIQQSSLQCVLVGPLDIYGAASSTEGFDSKSVNLGPDHFLCSAADSIVLNAFIPNAISYSWQDNSTDSIYVAHHPGTYSVTTTVGGCTSSDTIIIALAPPYNNILGGNKNLCIDDTLVLTTTSPFNTYLWQNGYCRRFFRIAQSGEYWVEVTKHGCSYQDTILVTLVHCSAILKMPDLVTPNGDGANDLFEPIKVYGITELNTRIYNRWGDMVFSSSNLKVEWNSSSVSDGIYYWVIEYIDLNENKSSQKGWVQVLR